MSDEGRWIGKRFAFTGRLASMSRVAACKVVTARGGAVSNSVSRCTDLLIVGREGWPFVKGGRPTAKLRRARSLARAGFGIEVLPEEVFLSEAGIASAGDVLGLHPLPVVASLAGTSRQRIETWMRAGLLVPARTPQGVPLFDYPGVAAARSLVALLSAGASLRQIVRSLHSIAEWLPEADEQADVLSRLSLDAGRLLLRTRDGRPIEATGQLQLPLDEADAQPVLAMTRREPVDSLFAEAVDRERAGDLEAAAELYRRVLLTEGPDADVAFNLGNALAALGQLDAAAERYRQAAEADPDLADARQNLGNVLLESGRCHEAIAAYSQAIAIEPTYADAHYGLAGAFEECHRLEEARRHWTAYLDLEPAGECAEYARRRLRETGARPTG